MSRSVELCAARLEDLAEKLEGAQSLILMKLASNFNTASKHLVEMGSADGFPLFSKERESANSNAIQIEQLISEEGVLQETPALMHAISTYNSYVKQAIDGMSQAIINCPQRLRDLAEESEGAKRSMLTRLGLACSEVFKDLNEMDEVKDFDIFCDKTESIESSIIQIEQLLNDAEMILRDAALMRSIRMYMGYIKQIFDEKEYNAPESKFIPAQAA